MPKGIKKEDVHNGARAFAKKQFGLNHQYVFALHNDTDNPHVHLAVKNLGFDNKRLHVKKGDPQQWREAFAEELNTLGVEASATHRTVRGVIKKSTQQAINQIRKDTNRQAKTDNAKKAEVLNEYLGKETKAKPWEKKIIERQTHVRKTWLQASKDLSKSKRVEDQQLAKEILSFVKQMPPLKTERHDMMETLAAIHQKQNIKNNDNAPER